MHIIHDLWNLFILQSLFECRLTKGTFLLIEGMEEWTNLLDPIEPRTPDRRKISRMELAQSPHFRESYVLLEYKRLCDSPVPGIYILPSENHTFEWCGVVFVDNGPWAGGAFHFKIYIPEEYPTLPPMIRFDSHSHPSLKENKRAWSVEKLCSALYPWNPDKHTLRTVVRCIPIYFLELQIPKPRHFEIEQSIATLPEDCHRSYSSIRFKAAEPDHECIASYLETEGLQVKNGNELLFEFQKRIQDNKKDLLSRPTLRLSGQGQGKSQVPAPVDQSPPPRQAQTSSSSRNFFGLKGKK